MKRFGTLFLAAVLGSVSTIATFEWIDKDDNKGANVEYLAGVPASKVAYKVDENGEVVPLDFTTAAEKVMPAVVHIRSTQDGTRRTEQEQIPRSIPRFLRTARTTRAEPELRLRGNY